MSEDTRVFRRLPDRLLPLALVLCLILASGCVQIEQTGRTGRSIWVFGFARIKVPDAEAGLAQPVAFEITGVGLSVGRATQLGYFRDFEVHLRGDSNSAVIIVRSKAELEHLKRVLTELQQQNLCIISQS